MNMNGENNMNENHAWLYRCKVVKQDGHVPLRGNKLGQGGKAGFVNLLVERLSPCIVCAVGAIGVIVGIMNVQG